MFKKENKSGIIKESHRLKKILFLIHDLGQGGAEKVLINLVNNMDYSKFDVTVMTLFDCGENRQFLSSKVHYETWSHRMVPGNSHLMKLLSPERLHKLIIKKHYDIEVAYLEGPCARVISGCSDSATKLVSWIHIEQHTGERAAASFRSITEAKQCYGKFHKIICVSQAVKDAFKKALQVESHYEVLYNTNESGKIIQSAQELVTDTQFLAEEIKLVGVGKLLGSKGFDRILRIAKRLLDERYPIHIYVLGEGPERDSLQRYIKDNQLENRVTLLGYQLNPYKYVAKCDLFVCASYAEGFSTAATEALILGLPVCTVDVSGMKEMLGTGNEYGVVVPNDDEALYKGIKLLLEDVELMKHYRKQATLRGKNFSTENTTKAVEKMLLSL